MASVRQSVPAAADDDGVEEELQTLVWELLKLDIGVKTECVVLARALAEEGVMTLDHLRLIKAEDARHLLQNCGMQRHQHAKVIQEQFSPAPGCAAAPPLDLAALKVAAAARPLPFLPDTLYAGNCRQPRCGQRQLSCRSFKR
jgi:hypothetical protein